MPVQSLYGQPHEKNVENRPGLASQPNHVARTTLRQFPIRVKHSAVDQFQDAALVLVGHGSSVKEEASASLRQHVVALRDRRCFGSVHEAFWKQEPRVEQVVSALTEPRVFIVPFFMSEGYFSESIIPQALGFRAGAEAVLDRRKVQGSQVLHYCKPVGTHPGMTSVLLDRAASVVARFPFPRAPRPKDITLFVAGHGTEQNENSRVAVERQVDLLRATGTFAGVHGLFIEEAPRIEEAYGLAATRNLVVVPFFVGDGLHVAQDIPVLLGEPERVVKERLARGQPGWRNPTEKQGKLVWYALSVGSDPLMVEVILQRVREALQS